MGSDKRTVATDALETLGTAPLGPEQKRDAIHLAVEPVVAGERLGPGEHITVKDGVATLTLPGRGLGVVDPFLPRAVARGERFWFIMYPRQVQSLRHVWTHPSFPDEAGTPALPAPAPQPADSKATSVAWMTAWAVKHMGEDYYGDGGPRDPQTAYEHAISAGHEHHIGPYESARYYIDNEWWGHWEAITGEKGDREAYFSCGC